MFPLYRFFLIMVLLTSAAHAGGKSKPLYIGFHSEADATDNPKMIKQEVIDGEVYAFHISPDLVTRHFSAFHTFYADDGTMGAALRLNEAGLQAYQVMISMVRGKLTRVIVNGRPVDIQRITAPKRFDGYMIIWKGLNEEDVKLMAKKLKRLDAPPPSVDYTEPPVVDYTDPSAN